MHVCIHTHICMHLRIFIYHVLICRTCASLVSVWALKGFGDAMPNMPPEAVAKGVAARARAGAAAAGKDADLHPSQENPSWASKKPSQQAPEGAGQGGGCQGRGQGGRWHGEGAGEGPLAGQRSWAKGSTPAPRAAACDHQKMGALSTSATTTTTSTTSTTSTTAAGTPTTTTATKYMRAPMGI